MFEKLKELELQYEEIGKKLSDPETIKDQKKYRELAKSYNELEPVVFKYREFLSVENELWSAQKMVKKETDPDMREFLKQEIDSLIGKREAIETYLKDLLVESDPRDEKNIIVEIRAGAGGEEASLFAADLYRMYTKYAEFKKWKTQALNTSLSDLGGIKEMIFEVKGGGAFSRLKFESGVHRVQRIPETESGGRIHTSTATVAVLPEVEEVEVEIDLNDVRVDTYRSSGAGGQHVNVTDSAVRLTHEPTGIVVTCQNERSQIQNREQAFKILRARLGLYYQEKQDKEIARDRRDQVGTGDRSERIRTYNFPQNRVTDHRIGLSVGNLAGVLEGDLDKIIDPLQQAAKAEKLKASY